MMPDIKVPPNYRELPLARRQATLFRGRGRRRPSWYTEYNVLTGLSVRSYGRFAESVTRLAAGRVKRGLPMPCGVAVTRPTASIPGSGPFGAPRLPDQTGIEHFLDAKALGVGPADADGFYYDHAARVIAQERGNGPVFVFVYLATNHFPWDYRYRPDLMPVGGSGKLVRHR